MCLQFGLGSFLPRVKLSWARVAARGLRMLDLVANAAISRAESRLGHFIFLADRNVRLFGGLRLIGQPK